MELRRILLAVIGTIVIASTASATPVAPPATSAMTLPTQVVPIHGWHRNCEWGPLRYHRHVRGAGNVRCYRRRPRFRYCRRWRVRCADRWGWDTWRFRRCLRLRDC